MTSQIKLIYEYLHYMVLLCSMDILVCKLSVFLSIYQVISCLGRIQPGARLELAVPISTPTIATPDVRVGQTGPEEG